MIMRISLTATRATCLWFVIMGAGISAGALDQAIRVVSGPWSDMASGQALERATDGEWPQPTPAVLTVVVSASGRISVWSTWPMPTAPPGCSFSSPTVRH